MDRNGPKWTEMDRNGPKWTEMEFKKPQRELNMDRNGVRMTTIDTKYGQGYVHIGIIRNVYRVLLNIGNPTPARTLQCRHPVQI